MKHHIIKSVAVAALTLAVSAVSAVEIWVSSTGSDSSPGTKEQPMQTITAALRQGRELRRLNDPSVADGVYIILRGGRYNLTEEVFIRAEDSGTPTSPTVIKNADGETPELSGGLTVGDWRLAKGAVAGLPKAAQGKVWVAKAPMPSGRSMDFRQMWVNGEKAVRARDNDPENMQRILSWSKKDRHFWIPTPKAWTRSGDPSPMEMTIHQMWAVAHLRIKSFEVHGDSTLVKIHDPEARIEFEHPWPTPMIGASTGNSPFYLSNSITLLDEPGEWFFDAATNNIYYYPRAGENMSSAEVTVPAVETLINMAGTLDRPVSHVSIDGLKFAYTTWLRPSQKGHVPIQAGMYLLDAYKLPIPGTPEKRGLENQAWHGRPVAAVNVICANNTSVKNCRFEHLASAGLDYGWGTSDDRVEGNLFNDIAGNAIQYGKFADDPYEIHLPYDPQDRRELSQKATIANNLINDCGNEDWGCVGIAAGCVNDMTIENNELSELPYSGISLGWGWTKRVGSMRNNTVRRNYIHHYARHMYDVAGIYTLSAQANTEISENRVEEIYSPDYVHDPNHWFYLYTDEGSSFMQVKNNWCPAEKFLQNANGPGNLWENNGPQVDEAIKNAAGLSPEYKHLRTLLQQPKTPSKTTQIQAAPKRMNEIKHEVEHQ